MSIMSLFRRADYQSEITQFIGQLKADRPTLESEQRAGRALLWERVIDREAAQEAALAEVSQTGHVG